MQHIDKGVIEEFMKNVGYRLAKEIPSTDVNVIQDHIYVTNECYNDVSLCWQNAINEINVIIFCISKPSQPRQVSHRVKIQLLGPIRDYTLNWHVI